MKQGPSGSSSTLAATFLAQWRCGQIVLVLSWPEMKMVEGTRFTFSLILSLVPILHFQIHAVGAE